MQVKELMTVDPSVCTEKDSLDDAARWMLEKDCGSLPVVSGKGREVVGMITDRDVCMAAHREGKPLKELRVDGAMSRDVLACSPGDDLADAARKMGRGQVRRLPVVGAKGIEGVLTLSQIARAERKTSGVGHEQVTQVLSSISQPTSAARAAAATS